MATGRMCGTGFMWRTIVRRSHWYWRGEFREKLTTSAVGMRSPTWRSCTRFAISWMKWRGGRGGGSRRELIAFVKDRPGHDRRYAMDARKIERELGWRPKETFETGIRKTIRWYLENKEWVQDVTSGSYRQWISTHYSV